MVSESTFLTGHSFVNCVRLKGGLVYTALRVSRGRPEASTRCDACKQTETVGHILQVCRRTHDDRVNRHDSVNKLLTAELTKGGGIHDASRTPDPYTSRNALSGSGHLQRRRVHGDRCHPHW